VRNDYPPDFTAVFVNGTADPNRTMVLRHVSHSYQRLNLQERNLIANSLTTNSTQAVNPNAPSAQQRFLWQIDPAEALVFWLALLYDHNQYPVSGFNGSAQRKPHFPFVAERLLDVDGDNWPEYYPSTRPDEPPYVYLNHQTYPFSSYAYPSVSNPAKGIAIAYLSEEVDGDPNNPFVYRFTNPQKFQIICPGLDGRYNDRDTATLPANYPRFPSGANYRLVGELDNITNFSEGELEDKIDR
jgi:hypothetical protein